jgi:hypothetical protein
MATDEEARIGVKELRRNLKRYLEGDAAHVIGGYWKVRAILVPIQSHRSYSRGVPRAQLAAARRAFLAALATLRE